jgi:hypothetical protein
MAFEFALLFLHETFELVEQLAISFGDRIDDASEHRFDLIGAVAQQAIDDVLLDPALKLFS